MRLQTCTEQIISLLQNQTLKSIFETPPLAPGSQPLQCCRLWVWHSSVCGENTLTHF